MKKISLALAERVITILVTCFAAGLCCAQTKTWEQPIDGQISIVNENMQLLTPNDADFGWCVGNHFTLSIRVEQVGNQQKVTAKFTWSAIEHDINNCNQIEPDPAKRSELVGSNESSMWTAAPGETIKLPPDSEEFAYDWTQEREHFGEQNIVPSRGPIAHINFLLLRQTDNHFLGAHAIAYLKGFKVSVTRPTIEEPRTTVAVVPSPMNPDQEPKKSPITNNVPVTVTKAPSSPWEVITEMFWRKTLGKCFVVVLICVVAGFGIFAVLPDNRKNAIIDNILHIVDWIFRAIKFRKP